MNIKEIREIRKLYTKERCSVSRLCGCYVNAEKEKVATFSGSLLGMSDSEQLKYMEIFKKCLSGSIGKSLFNIDIPLKFEMQDADAGREDTVQSYRMLSAMHSSGLRNEDVMDIFYDRIIESFHHTGNYMILTAADTYDIPGKSRLGDTMDDASEESFSYFLCAICPVELGKPGLKFSSDEGWFTAIDRDWIAEKPAAGFMFPAFNDRSTDIHAALFYAGASDALQFDLIDSLFGSDLPVTSEDKKEAFGTLVSEVYGDGFNPEDVKNIHETLAMEAEAIKNEPSLDDSLSRSHLRSILEKSGATDEQLDRFEDSFDAVFGDDPDLIIDNIYNKRKFEVKSDSVRLSISADRTDLIRFEKINGTMCAIVELEGEVEVNGVSV